LTFRHTVFTSAKADGHINKPT